jgi:hypothetical protein
LTTLASITHASFFLPGSNSAAERLQRKRLITALSVAVMAHAVVLVVLAQPARFKLGIDRAEPVMTRWIDAPAVPSAGLARQDPVADAQPTPRAQAPAEPTTRSDRTRPTPRPARNDDKSAAAAPTTPASAAAAASPLPEGQDPLLMLPTTPERFQMLDRLSRDIDADPSMYAPGNAISISIDLDGQTKVWRFVIVGEEPILSLGGLQVPTLRLLHHPENDRDARVEVWLVPQLAHRPVQMLITRPGELNSDLHIARAALDPLDQAARNARGAPAPTAPASQ